MYVQRVGEQVDRHAGSPARIVAGMVAIVAIMLLGRVEGGGRGAAPIRGIRVEVAGAALPLASEQRSDVIWRGSSTVPVTPGRHSVRALVVDAQGRSGSYRWSFEAGT